MTDMSWKRSRRAVLRGLGGMAVALPALGACRQAPSQPAAATPQTIIDTHTHVIFDNPEYQYKADFTADDLIKRMDATGVAKTIVVQSRSGNGLDSPYPSQQAALHPERLIAICGLDVTKDDAAAVLRARAPALNARGVRTFWGEVDPNDARFEPIWAAVTELRLPVLLSGEVTYENLTALIERHRDIRFVMDHIGQPDLSKGMPAGLKNLAGHENLHLKFSSLVVEEAENAGVKPAELLAWLVENFGADKLMWGSNYPSSHEPRWSYGNCVETVKSMVAPYTAEQQRLILSGTAISVWPALAT